jgi:perosamine synthetase
MISIAKPLIDQEEKAKVLEVLDSGELASGRYVTEFENDFAVYVESDHAIAASSGTTALHLAVEALGIGKGDKVFTTPFTFIATANAILYAGATPVFVDIDPVSFNLSPNALRKAVTEHPEAKAIMVVHLYGQAADMNEILEIAKENNLLVIEDCAQSHGAEYRGRKVGSIGDAGMFSFYPTKNMTTGEGGMLTTSNREVAERARLLVNHGQKVRYRHEVLGYNFRMTNIHAAIGIEQLKKLERFNSLRRENAAYLTTNIKNELIELPVELEGNKHVFHQYTVKLHTDRDKFIDFLQKKEIGYGIHYPIPLMEQPLYKDLGLDGFDCPVASELAKCVVSLPVHPALTKEQLEYIVAAINEYRG